MLDIDTEPPRDCRRLQSLSGSQRSRGVGWLCCLSPGGPRTGRGAGSTGQAFAKRGPRRPSGARAAD